MPDHAQVAHGRGARFLRIVHGLQSDLHGELLHLVAQVGQRGDEFVHLDRACVLGDELLHQLAEFAQLGATVHQHLATEQIQRLDGVGSLVNHVDARIAQQLFDAPLVHVAVPAEYLQALRDAVECVVAQEGLGHRRHQGQHVGGNFARRRIRVVVLLVDHQGQPVGKCATAFGPSARGQQRAAHVGMHDDRVGRPFGLSAPRQAATLHPVLGVGGRILIGRLGQAQALHAHREARTVHHHEHRIQAPVRLPDQPAGGCLEHHLAGRVGVNAHLVLDAPAIHAVARADAGRGTFAFGKVLGYQEQRNALGAGGRIGQPRQNQVHDVVGQVVLAGRNEDLLAGDPVAAVGLRFGPRAQQAQIGAAMRLGQAHGAGPVGRHQLGQIDRLLLGRAVGPQALVGALGQSRVHGP